jgi:hypothetical protein
MNQGCCLSPWSNTMGLVVAMSRVVILRFHFQDNGCLPTVILPIQDWYTFRTKQPTVASYFYLGQIYFYLDAAPWIPWWYVPVRGFSRIHAFYRIIVWNPENYWFHRITTGALARGVYRSSQGRAAHHYFGKMLNSSLDQIMPPSFRKMKQSWGRLIAGCGIKQQEQGISERDCRKDSSSLV